MKAPLGPTTRKGTCYFDEMGHEYTSVEHLLRCAIARALGVEK
jgi:hypothetical protein